MSDPLLVVSFFLSTEANNVLSSKNPCQPDNSLKIRQKKVQSTLCTTTTLGIVNVADRWLLAQLCLFFKWSVEYLNIFFLNNKIVEMEIKLLLITWFNITYINDMIHNWEYHAGYRGTLGCLELVPWVPPTNSQNHYTKHRIIIPIWPFRGAAKSQFSNDATNQQRLLNIDHLYLFLLFILILHYTLQYY